MFIEIEYKNYLKSLEQLNSNLDRLIVEFNQKKFDKL
jgi:hypothetical protein